MNTMQSMKAAALWYAEHGVPVFPVHYPVQGGGCSCKKPDCAHPGKHPRTPHGFKDATTDQERINSWWAECPFANIGIPTGAASGLVVVDCDPRNGGSYHRQRRPACLLSLCGWVRSERVGSGNRPKGGRRLRPGSPVATYQWQPLPVGWTLRCKGHTESCLCSTLAHGANCDAADWRTRGDPKERREMGPRSTQRKPYLRGWHDAEAWLFA
jgi:Bifunctional DNA primase/polymerase, N-terminal